MVCARARGSLRGVICTSRDGDRFWRLPEVIIRGNNIKYLRIPEEVIDMVEMPPGSGNFVSRAEALATMRAQGAPMTDPNASSMERIRQARMLREQGI